MKGAYSVHGMSRGAERGGQSGCSDQKASSGCTHTRLGMWDIYKRKQLWINNAEISPVVTMVSVARIL